MVFVRDVGAGGAWELKQEEGKGKGLLLNHVGMGFCPLGSQLLP
jgi:hypothetical protein